MFKMKHDRFSSLSLTTESYIRFCVRHVLNLAALGSKPRDCCTPSAVAPRHDRTLALTYHPKWPRKDCWQRRRLPTDGEPAQSADSAQLAPV